MEGTSLPVGGENTHAAIVGHRGLPSATLFSHLDQVREGDKVYLHVLGEVLAYQVDAIETVLPREVDRLAITPGEDRLTLITCTPYSINTHRLLVHASRVAYEPEEEESIAAEKPRSAVVDTAFLFLALGLVCAALMVVLIPRYYRVKARRSERTQGPERPAPAERQSKKPKGGKRLVEKKKRKRRSH